MMKGKVYLIMLAGVLLLSACSSEMQKETEGTESKMTTENMSVSETEQEDSIYHASVESESAAELDFSAEGNTYVIDDFTGLETTVNIAAGNTGENLSAAGYVCDTEAGVFYATEEGIAWKKEAGIEWVYDQSADYLNYFDGKLYFITQNDRKIHVLSLENGETETILEDTKAYYLCVTDLGILYVNHKNALYLLDDKENMTLISDKAPGWMNFYGEWLIFAESANQSCLAAVNCITGEKKQLLSYAMFPCIAGEKLYYSGCEDGENSFIGELNLTTGENRSLGDCWSGSKVVLDSILYFISGDRVYGLDLENPVHGEEVYSDTKSDLLSISQEKLLFWTEGKIMYLFEGAAYEYEAK